MSLIRVLYRWFTQHRRERLAEAARQERIAAYQHERLKRDLEAARQWCKMKPAAPVHEFVMAPKRNTAAERKP